MCRKTSGKASRGRRAVARCVALRCRATTRGDSSEDAHVFWGIIWGVFWGVLRSVFRELFAEFFQAVTVCIGSDQFRGNFSTENGSTGDAKITFNCCKVEAGKVKYFGDVLVGKERTKVRCIKVTILELYEMTNTISC